MTWLEFSDYGMLEENNPLVHRLIAEKEGTKYCACYLGTDYLECNNTQDNSTSIVITAPTWRSESSPLG
jgi:hypothetical protein